MEIHERSVPVSRYERSDLPSGGLTTSIVAVVTDVVRDGHPVIGYGFGSVGRYAQGGLIRERFAPRLLAARPDALVANGEGQLDPLRASRIMLAGEKPGGHGERCVAVGALDMALWDAAAKIRGLPLHLYLKERFGDPAGAKGASCPAYAAGGYYYPDSDLKHLTDEVRRMRALGFSRVKIKIGGAPLGQDLRRIEAVIALLDSPDCLAVDAMNAYGPAAHRANCILLHVQFFSASR